MRALRRLLPYYAPYRWQVILGLAFVVISSALASVTPWLLRAALDGIRAGLESRRIWTLAGAMVGLALVAGVLRYGMRELINGLSRRIEYDLRNDLFAHLLRLDAGYFGRTRTGDIMARLTNDLSAVRQAVGPAIMYLTNTIAGGVFDELPQPASAASIAISNIVLTVALPFFVLRSSDSSRRKRDRGHPARVRDIATTACWLHCTRRT